MVKVYLAFQARNQCPRPRDSEATFRNVRGGAISLEVGRE